ncbi:1972_t:CDS:2, partial [Funneliformis caledonium]
SSNTSKILGIIPYIDPKSFKNYNQSQKFKLNMKSDVYSVGVLLWQISSGHRPFENVDYDMTLFSNISKGCREKIINGTPMEYCNLYQECWKYKSKERPDMQKVVSVLDKIEKNMSLKSNGINTIERYRPNSELGETNTKDSDTFFKRFIRFNIQ